MSKPSGLFFQNMKLKKEVKTLRKLLGYYGCHKMTCLGDECDCRFNELMVKYKIKDEEVIIC